MNPPNSTTPPDTQRLNWLEWNVCSKNPRFAGDVFATWAAHLSLREAIDKAMELRPPPEPTPRQSAGEVVYEATTIATGGAIRVKNTDRLSVLTYKQALAAAKMLNEHARLVQKLTELHGEAFFGSDLGRSIAGKRLLRETGELLAEIKKP